MAWSQIGILALATAFADDLDRAEPYRGEIKGLVDVLTASQTTVSAACSSALDEVETTDSQLKELGGQLEEGGVAPQALQGEQNEVGVARDVMASDLQSAVSACRPDAERACASAPSSRVAQYCEALDRDIEREPAAKR